MKAVTQDMSRSLCGLMVVLALGLTGCESIQSVKESVQQRWAGPVGKQRVFAAPQREAYAAAKSAVEAMGFRFLRGGPAQGEIDAISGIRADDALRSSRQVSLKVRLRGTGEGTEIRLILTEIIESNYNKGPGLGTETALKDTPLYEVFFRQVGQALGAGAK